MTLQAFFTAHPRAALAFSGGVDSAFLLWAARACGAEIQPYYVNSQFQPAFELSDAKRLCRELGAPLTVLDVDVLTVPEVVANGPRRCYFCKRAIFSAIAARAKADGFDLLLDGSNASDDAGDRPGMQALRELSVRSPLRECGLTKAEIRERSREAGLFTWDKPAYACLATRIETGTPITSAALETTEAAEAALTALGYRDFRVRMREGGRCALLQFTAADRARYLADKDAADAALRPYYEHITLDQGVRSGHG